MKRILLVLLSALMAVTLFAQKPQFWGLEVGTHTGAQFKALMAEKEFTPNKDIPGIGYTGVMDGCFTVATADVDPDTDIMKSFGILLYSQEWESHQAVMLEFANALVQMYGENYKMTEPNGEEFDQQYKFVLRHGEDAIIFENEALEDGTFQTSVLFTSEYSANK